ncbi:MAG TPA: TetR/AcrR family transcriptional regulator [Phototrophicaceae bacterium]|jgi:AcrR family transcriptional regulator|nr:TetR/AcrR family transcriptional regulator [Phototrophicaceae bacterium]
MSTGDPETRNRILAVTRHLMETRQGQGVRLEDIAKAAGVSRQAVYMHFGSRPGLLIATARYLDETLGLSERVRPIFEAQTAVQALDALVVFWGNYIPDIYGLAKALLNARAEDDAAAAAWDDRMEAVYDKCTRVIQQIDREGKLAAEWSIETGTDFCWSLLAISEWEHLTLECGWSNEQYIARIQTVLRKTLLIPD